MKPIQVTMKAFGPYAGTQPIDFRKLDGQSLFLICGPTGAGKTAVLDAMSYALFGQASGLERHERQLRSDHAPIDTPTEVVFDFALKGQVFRVRRSPTQERPKKRGEGTTTENAKAWFFSRDENTPDNKDGEIIAEGVSEVTANIETRLGFGSAQFRQVILLPQGEFRRLLSSDSTQRQAVLEKLFQTKRYRKLEAALKKRVNLIGDTLHDVDVKKKTLLEQAEVADTDALTQKRAALGVALQELEVQTEAHQTAQRKAQTRLTTGTLTQKHLTERDQANKALVELVAKQGEFDTVAQDLARARRAKDLSSTENHLKDTTQTEKTSAHDLELAEAQLLKAHQDNVEAATQWTTVQAQGPQRDEASHRVKHLTTLNDAAAALERAREVADQAGATAGCHLRHAERARATLEDQVRSQAQVCDSITARSQRDAKTVADARTQLVEAEHARDAAQAAHLAQGLQDGSPCPVCGSDAHPTPAHLDVEMPPLDAVEQARAARDTAETALAKTQNQQQLADLALGELRTRAAQATAEIEAIASETRTRLRGLGAQQSPGDVQAALLAFHSANQALETCLAAIPEDLRAPGAIANAQSAAANTLKQLTEAHATAHAANDGARTKLAAQQATTDGFAKALKTATTRREAASTELDKRVIEAGFVDRADYGAARRDAATEARMVKQLESWRDKKARAEERATRAAAAADGLQTPDMAALTAQLEAAEHTLKEHTRAVSTTQNTIDQTQRIVDSIQEMMLRFAKAERTLSVVGRLADVANSDNAWRMGFERFVQAALLEEVLAAANLKLLPMTQKRYQLRRAADPADRRRLGGLDMEIIDAYTGEARPVSTLSGGEGFQTSLALALGLADTVQARSGGIALDAIFVDEGFGSLGEADLEPVIQTLQNLHGGNRLVGIISHVYELRQRIKTQLVVTKGRTGSSARFVLE